MYYYVVVALSDSLGEIVYSSVQGVSEYAVLLYCVQTWDRCNVYRLCIKSEIVHLKCIIGTTFLRVGEKYEKRKAYSRMKSS